MFILTCSTLVSCGDSGSTNKGKRDTTYTIVDTTDGSKAKIIFNTTKKTAVVKDLWYDVPEIGTKCDTTLVYVTINIPKKGNKTRINYSFTN